MLKLKVQYFGHLMRSADSFEKTLILGKIEGGRKRGWQRMRWLDGITDSIGISLSRRWWRTGKPDLLQSMRLQRVGRDWVTEQQQSLDPLDSSSTTLHTTWNDQKYIQTFPHACWGTGSSLLENPCSKGVTTTQAANVSWESESSAGLCLTGLPEYLPHKPQWLIWTSSASWSLGI